MEGAQTSVQFQQLRPCLPPGVDASAAGRVMLCAAIEYILAEVCPSWDSAPDWMVFSVTDIWS